MNIGNADNQKLLAIQDAMLAGADRPENSYEFLLAIGPKTGRICGRISMWSLVRGIRPDVDFLVGGSRLDPESHSGPTENEIWSSNWREPEATWQGALQRLLDDARADSADWKVRLRCPILERFLTDEELRRYPSESADISKEDVLRQDLRTSFGGIEVWRDLLIRSWRDPSKREKMLQR